MSLPAIRAALETALAAMSPTLATAWENLPYQPIVGTPYQAVYMLTATPDNREIGAGYTEQGIFQINLFYPLDAGPAAALARAELIRAAFPYAATFTASPGRVLITQTPEIAPARIEDDRYLVPVKIRFESYVGG